MSAQSREHLENAVDAWGREVDRFFQVAYDYCPVCGLKNWHWKGCPNAKDDE